MPDRLLTATDLANAAASGEPIAINGTSYKITLDAPQAPAQTSQTASTDIRVTSPGYAAILADREKAAQAEAAQAEAANSAQAEEQRRIAEIRATARSMYGKRSPQTRPQATRQRVTPSGDSKVISRA